MSTAAGGTGSLSPRASLDSPKPRECRHEALPPASSLGWWIQGQPAGGLAAVVGVRSCSADLSALSLRRGVPGGLSERSAPGDGGAGFPGAAVATATGGSRLLSLLSREQTLRDERALADRKVSKWFSGRTGHGTSSFIFEVHFSSGYRSGISFYVFGDREV